MNLYGEALRIFTTEEWMKVFITPQIFLLNLSLKELIYELMKTNAKHILLHSDKTEMYKTGFRKWFILSGTITENLLQLKNCQP
jgi:hypothetical protein